MGTEFKISLKEIKDILNKKINDSKKIKENMDEQLNIIKDLKSVESKFLDKLNNAWLVHKRLILFFESVEVENIKTVAGKLDLIKNNLDKELSSLQNEIKIKNFNKGVLNEYYSYLKNFFTAQEGFLDEQIIKWQQGIFEKAKNEIYEKSNTLIHLIDVLIKTIESSKKVSLREVLSEKSIKASSIKIKIPQTFNDILKFSEESIRGLYEKVMQEICSVRNEVVKLAIENKLLSEGEIAVLETLYAQKINELKLSGGIEYLKEKLKIEENEAKKLLFGLDEKGFINIKLIIE
jgi:hypothetical protein